MVLLAEIGPTERGLTRAPLFGNDTWPRWRLAAHSSSSSSSHSRQTQSPSWSSSALRSAGTMVTPQRGQIGGRLPSSTP